MIKDRVLIPRLEVLEEGVVRAHATGEEVELLEGPDNGLYARLGSVARAYGYKVVDDDDKTSEILRDGRVGLNKAFYEGPELLIKQMPPLRMAAVLAHELGHGFTQPVWNEDDLKESETVAEATAYLVCDRQGLDISPQAFTYIEGYNQGNFTDEMRKGTLVASGSIIQALAWHPAQD